jgi:putative membrane protein
MNMKRAFSAICCLVVLVVPALAQKAAPMSDQDFVTTAALTDMVEAHLGKLAEGPASSSQAVKDYGRMLVSDHTQDYQALQTLAQQAGFTVPTSIDAEHMKAMLRPLDGLQGKAFDQRYIQDMIKGHTAALALYRKEAQDATNPALRSYAQNTIPTLEKHLNAAKAIQMPPAM